MLCSHQDQWLWQQSVIVLLEVRLAFSAGKQPVKRNTIQQEVSGRQAPALELERFEVQLLGDDKPSNICPCKRMARHS